jgi:hypothetical protein
MNQATIYTRGEASALSCTDYFGEGTEWGIGMMQTCHTAPKH